MPMYFPMVSIFQTLVPSYSIDLCFFSVANTTPFAAVEERDSIHCKLPTAKHLSSIPLFLLYVCHIVLPLIPIVGAPVATAANAYSICTNFPEGLQARTNYLSL